MLLTIITFFAVLGLIVLVHEFGHFIVARKNKVRVDEFGFGIPPRIIGLYKDEQNKFKIVGRKQIETKNMIWSLNWIPLGGFVKIKGEQGEAAQDVDSFAHKSIGARAAILSAGVTMNIILAVILLSIGFVIGVPQAIDDSTKLSSLAKISDENIRIVQILPDTPAANAGLKIGDVLVNINDQSFNDVASIQNFVDLQIGQTAKFQIKRNNQLINLPITPEILVETNHGGIGVALVKTGIVSYPWYIAWWEGLKETGQMIVSVIVGLFLLVKNLLVDHQLIGEVYGPVGIASLVGDAARMGVLYLLQLTAALSVIIAVINYLPFPALDGGRVLFLIIEIFRGKPIDQKLEAIFHNVGFALLMLLILIVTFSDIFRIF